MPITLIGIARSSDERIRTEKSNQNAETVEKIQDS